MSSTSAPPRSPAGTRRAGPSATRTGAGAGAAEANLELLAGASADAVLRAVLAAEGVELVGWATHQVHHRPGVGVSVGWTVRWRQGTSVGEDYLLGTTAPVPSGTPGSTTVVVGGREVTVWRHPADPELPGLAEASDPAVVAGWLGAPLTALDLVTYRPLRRSVLRVTTSGRTSYLKVVRPARADALVQRHGLLRDAGVPAAPARLVAPGVALLDELPGHQLTDALAVDGASQVDPARVLDLLDRLPAAAVSLGRRRSWTDDVEHHAAAALAVLPARYRQIERLVRQVQRLVATADPGPVVATHGDLHEANLLVDGPRVVGLLDVDGLGPGHRVDDLACLLGHMSVLPVLAPRVHRHVPAALARWTRAFAATVDPVGLRARTAAVVLSLVAGARRQDGPWRADAEGRLAVAERWAAAALADERGLIATSATSHRRP